MPKSKWAEKSPFCPMLPLLASHHLFCQFHALLLLIIRDIFWLTASQCFQLFWQNILHMHRKWKALTINAVFQPPTCPATVPDYLHLSSWSNTALSEWDRNYNKSMILTLVNFSTSFQRIKGIKSSKLWHTKLFLLFIIKWAFFNSKYLINFKTIYVFPIL